MNQLLQETGRTVASLTGAGDDSVLPFEVKPLGVRGRLVRLGPALSDILRQHNYPAAVSEVLAQATTLASLLGSALKFEGTFILQTRTDGPVGLLVADYATPGNVRGYAQFGKEALDGLNGRADAAGLLGRGHLALTIDQGAGMERYQGIVALDGEGLEAAALTYFRQSEQIPTSLRLAAGSLVGRGREAAPRWRSGAIMVQHLPREGGASPMALTAGDAPDGAVEAPVEDDRWTKARLLLETVEDHELLDPTLSPEELLYRLFHEDGVTVYPAHAIAHRCSCSRERALGLIRQFPAAEQDEMLEDGKIVVTCQFCSATYRFDPSEAAS